MLFWFLLNICVVFPSASNVDPTPAVSVEIKHLWRLLTSADSHEDSSPDVKDAERNFTFYGRLKLMRPSSPAQVVLEEAS